MWYSNEYNPIQVGSIDGIDIDPHDHAIVRASLSSYEPPKYLKTDPNCTLFVSRLNFDTTESTLREFFNEYGKIANIELMRNNVTGLSQGYAFITYKDVKSAQKAYKDAHERTLDDHAMLVDYERSRMMKGWIPRRFGGGFGGKKESGQLRFGGRDRPFKRPPADSNIRVDYEQQRSDCWRRNDSISSSSKREERRRSRSPARQSSRRHGRSTSRDRRRRRSHSSSRRDREHHGSNDSGDSHRESTSGADRHRRPRSRDDGYHHRSRSKDQHDYMTSSKRHYESDKYHHYSDYKRKRYEQDEHRSKEEYRSRCDDHSRRR